MSFTIITDTSANLPLELTEARSITVVPFYYNLQGQELCCTDITNFDGKGYYDKIRAGAKVTTTQITPQHYVDAMRPHLEAGEDLLAICMSSGISGTYQSAEIAASQLREEFPDRNIKTVDTLGASLGEGIFALRAADYRDQGKSLDETYEIIMDERVAMNQVFTVDDLMHLRRGGRISGASAIVGTMLSIKPMLKGNEKGQIVAFGKIRGRRNSVKAIADNYNLLVKNPQEQMIGIAHADCQEDVDFLISMLNEKNPPKEILTVCYEPVTGSHVGPGGLALFFFGSRDYRSSWKYGK
jgi:DegV family protein with EDD domain